MVQRRDRGLQERFSGDERFELAWKGWEHQQREVTGRQDSGRSSIQVDEAARITGGGRRMRSERTEAREGGRWRGLKWRPLRPTLQQAGGGEAADGRWRAGGLGVEVGGVWVQGGLRMSLQSPAIQVGRT